MAERSLPASPNWYCSRCSDVSTSGLLGVGAKNIIYLIDVSASSCRVVGELVGHKGLVSGFSFCHHAGQNQLCVSSSNDGAVLIWDSETKSVTKEHPGHQSPVSAVHWSPLDKNLVVSGDEKGIVLCHWYHTGDSASFFPEPRTIVCLSCSPHTWSSVAVGYKDGMIVLIDISKKGEVMHRLRGHDDEIHSLAWSPVAGEATLSSRVEDGEVTNGLSTGDEQGCFLASGSKDQTVRIWSTAKGRGVTTLKLPYLKRRGSAVDPGVKERLWLNVHWPKRWPTQLVSSCFSGELVKWDLTKSGKQKCSLFGSSEGQNHSRIVFNMSSVQLQDERELLISTSMDRDIKCWDLSSLDCCWTLPTLGGFAYALAFSPVGTGCLALGVGDNMIRVWNTLTTQNQYDTRTFWQGIKSKVTALAWHPKREGTLAFGTDDGKVGIYEVFSNKPPQVSSSYHKKTVYTLAWGPPVPPMSFGASGKQSYSLYSCAGEGTILQHDVSRLSGEASDIDKLIRDTNSIKHKLSPHTDLSWKPDGSVVAIGNEDGCIEIYQAPSLKLLCSIQQHHKIINTLRWHPENDGAAPQMHGLLASGSNNAIVYVHDLGSLIENPPESPAVLTEPFRRLSGHTAKITGMAWSPHHAAKLVTASYDGTAQVWDVMQEEGVANYRGHVGNLLCVDWSPVDADVIWSGGKDFTVQEWRVSQQEFTKPPKGKKMVEMQEKMKAKKKKKSKKASEAGTDGEAAPAAAAPEASDGEEEREVSSTSSPAPSQVTYEAQRKPSTTTTMMMKNKEKTDVNALKKRKPRSMMPVTMAMEQRPKEELLQDCVTLATIKHSQVPPAGCVPGQAEHTHLGLFADRAALYRMFEAEEESHVEAGHFESVVYLRLWSGDLEGALKLATERGELNDHLLAIAPTAGFQVWTRTVEAYVKQLCLQEQHLKAASHLLSINRLYEAVDLLRSHKLYREAIALVKARLPEEEPVLRELYSSWAAVLEKDGHFSAAAKCHVALGASFDAAKVIARKNDVPSLRTAASVARICGEAALAQSLALRCAKDLAAALDWTAAQEVLGSQEQSMLVHRLHLSATELLAAALSDVSPLTCVSSHPWAAPSAEPHRRRRRLLERLTHVWEEQFGVSGADRAGALLRELKTTETPAPTGSVPLRQMLLYSSLHLARGALSWLSGDTSDLVKELWAGLSWFRESGHFNICAKLCKTLFPDGEVTFYTNTHQNLSDQPAAGSLQAFVKYHRLYERWWSHSGGGGGGGGGCDEMQNGFADDKKGQVVNGGPECADSEVRQLLSEPHAAAQASQRAMREGQERLSAMVLQHGKKQRDEEEEQAPTEAERSRSGEPETFLSLSAKMSEHQKQLAELPEDIKAFPYPDVLECCLVLLYLGRSSPSVTESLQQEAKELLRKHGHSPSILKASRRFLI